MRINEIIREKRRELGITQEQAAERLGVTASAFNKWERAASLPDITLLPALARLLRVDINTLLGFSGELSEAETGEFLNSLDALAKSEGYDAAFRRAVEKLHEYPGSERLLLSTACYLDGALFLYGVDGGPYRAKLDAWYERLLESGDAEVRESALVMVLNRCRQNGELGRAEELLNSVPRSQIDRQEQLALLYTAQGRADEARLIWQSRALGGISQAVTAMQHLADEAVKSGRREDALRISETIYDLTLAAGLPEWMGLASMTAIAEDSGDEDKYAGLLQRLRTSLNEPWNASGPIYGELSPEGINELTSRISALLETEEQQIKDRRC